MAEHVVKLTENIWNETAKNDELVLVFQLKNSRGNYLPSLIEITPEPPESEPQPGSYRVPIQSSPCTYLNCSAIRNITTEYSPSELGFVISSLAILRKRLTQTHFVKILIVAQLEFFSSETCDSPEWLSCLMSCPILKLMQELDISHSVGLVLVSKADKRPRDANDPTGRTHVVDLRNNFLVELVRLRQKLEEKPEAYIAYQFLKKITRTKHFMILENNRVWDEKIFSVLSIRSPLGYKVLRFCKKLRVSQQISGSVISTTVLEGGEASTIVTTNKAFQKVYRKRLEQHVRAELIEISNQINKKVQSSGYKNQDVVCLAREVIKAQEICSGTCKNRNLVEMLTDIMNALSITKNEDNLRELQTELEIQKFVAEVTETPTDNQDLMSKQLAVFLDRLRNQMLPKLSKQIASERLTVCGILENAYVGLVHSLCEEYQSLLRQTDIERLIETIGLDLEMVETLTWNKTLVTQLEIYKKLRSVSLESVLDAAAEENLHQLETRHQELETLLQNLGGEYHSCYNHSASTVVKPLLEKLNNMKGIMIHCNAIVMELKAEISVFAQDTINKFCEMVLQEKTNGKTTDEIVNMLEKVTKTLSTRVDTLRKSEEALFSISKEIDFVSDLLLNCHSNYQAKFKASVLLNQLEMLCTSKLSPAAFENIVRGELRVAFTSEFQPNKNNFWEAVSGVIELKEFTRSYQSTSRLSNNTLYHTWPMLKAVADDMLNAVVEQTMKIETGDILRIFGTVVKFSEFVQLVNLPKQQKFQQLRVHSKEKVYIDANLTNHSELEVVVIAPVVEVVEQPTITLDGKNGESHQRTHWDSSAKIPGTLHGMHGKSGRPGNPGGNGGHYYVICNTIKNASKLRVNCRGGNGGDGGKGYNGCDGGNGEDAWHRGIGEFRGQMGGRGGDGGDGGKGGLPGFGGSVQIFAYTEHDGAVKISTKSGNKGMDGGFGIGGRGGKRGNGLKREKGLIWGTNEHTIPCGEVADSGSCGTSGRNTIDMVIPKQKLEPENFGKAIAEYREFVKASNKNSAASKLLTEIDKDTTLMKWISPKLLAQELLQIEFGENISQVEILNRYKHFQERVHLYRDWAASTNRISGETTNVLGVLDAFVTSQYILLKERHNESVSGAQVINLQGYFQIIAENINLLKESSVNLKRIQSLSIQEVHLKQYWNNVNQKIKKSVMPAIENASLEMEREMRKLVRELQDCEDQLQQDLRCRRQDFEAFQKIVRLSDMKKSMELVSSATNIMLVICKGLWPGVASAIGMLANVTGAITMGMNDRIPDEPTYRPNLKLPECFSENTNIVDNQEKQLVLVRRFLDQNQKIGEALYPLLLRWEEGIQKYSETGMYNSHEVCMEMEQNRVEVLEEILKSKEIFQEDKELERNIDKLIIEISICNCRSDISMEIPIVWGDLAGNQNRESLVATQQHCNILKKQKQVYTALIPLVKALSGHLISTVSDNRNSNAVDRRVDQYQLKGLLNEFKNKLKDFLKGLKSESSIQNAIQSIEETVSLLFDLYALMEKYEDSQRFSKALESITNQSFGFSSNIMDTELRQNISKIEFLLRANLFRMEYNEAVKAFKQWVFPFAPKYLLEAGLIDADKEVDSDLVLDDDTQLQTLASKFKSKFELLQRYLLKYKAVALDIDSVLFTGKFSSKSETNPPFYTWTTEEFGEEIGKLLDGQQVELNADVWNAAKIDDGRRAAVKFRKIELILKHKSGNASAEQKKLNKILRENYSVSMVHSGISYYRLLGDCFTMRGQAQEYSYNFDWSVKNEAYRKLELDGDYLFSPYTSWRLRLENKKSKSNLLKDFDNYVDLELSGDGWYVDEKKVMEKQWGQSFFGDLRENYELE